MSGTLQTTISAVASARSNSSKGVAFRTGVIWQLNGANKAANLWLIAPNPTITTWLPDRDRSLALTGSPSHVVVACRCSRSSMPRAIASKPANAVSATGSAKNPAKFVSVRRWLNLSQSKFRYSPNPTDSNWTHRRDLAPIKASTSGLPKATSQPTRSLLSTSSAAPRPARRREV